MSDTKCSSRVFLMAILVGMFYILLWDRYNRLTNVKLEFKSTGMHGDQPQQQNIRGLRDSRIRISKQDRSAIKKSLKRTKLENNSLGTGTADLKTTTNGISTQNVGNARKGKENTSVNTGVKLEVRTHYVLCPIPRSRLGNQMFQLAAVIGLAHSLNFVPIISDSHPLVNFFELENVKLVSNLRLDNMKVVGLEWLDESKENYLQHNLTLDGYFQSWKYFQNVSVAVRKAFTIKPTYVKTAKSFLSENIIGIKTLIGIHIRRGDFLSPRNQKKGRIVAEKNYFAKAMALYRQLYSDAYFVVCSNDIRWCRQNIHGNDVVFSEFEEAILDMAVMSLCHHMIITYGTFSWWGGWMAGGTVVRIEPRESNLFLDRHYPQHWIRMSNGK